MTPTKGTRRKQVTPNKATSMMQKAGQTAKTITLQHAKAGESRNPHPSKQKLAAHSMAPSNATKRHIHLSKQMLPAKAMVSSIATEQQVASQMKAVDSVRKARTNAVQKPQTASPMKTEAAARIYTAPSQLQNRVDESNSHKPLVECGSGLTEKAVPRNSISVLDSTTINAAQANNTFSSQTPSGPIPNNFTTMTSLYTSMVTQAHNSELDTNSRLGLKLRFKIPQDKRQTPIPMEPESRPVHLTQYKAKPDISVATTPK